MILPASTTTTTMPNAYIVQLGFRTVAAFTFADYGGEREAHRAAREFCSAHFSWRDGAEIQPICLK